MALEKTAAKKVLKPLPSRVKSSDLTRYLEESRLLRAEMVQLLGQLQECMAEVRETTRLQLLRFPT